MAASLLLGLAALSAALAAPYPSMVTRGPPITAPPLPVPAPTNFLIMNDPKACPAHGGFAGGLACQALLPKGGLALVWQYGANHIDGFRAYTVPNPRAASPAPQNRWAAATITHLGPNAPIATQTARMADGSVATLIVLDPRAGGYENVCFTVTAYAGETESPMSRPFCVGSNATAKTVSLAPVHSLTSTDELFFDPSKGGPAPCCDNHNADPDPFRYGAVLFVGHYRNKITTGPTINAGVHRGGLLYDVGALRGSKIYKAVLRFTREEAGGSSCITEIDTGPSAWWTAPNNYLPRAARLMSTDSYAGRTFDIDVTPIVSNWAAGQPNNGLVLIGDTWPNVVYQLENIGDNCVTSLTNVTLEVTYF
ncbi:MAG: hypothetical protein ACHP84_07355 [Caulobacterales bacterium]